MVRIYRYKLINSDIDNSILDKISTHIPTPNETDYKRGYITRYFVQSANDPSSPVYEVDKDEYSLVVENSFYINVKLNWRLIGTVGEVRESNSKAVLLASKTIKSITLYLSNALQFYKR
jgi:hypothetical protein